MGTQAKAAGESAP